MLGQKYLGLGAQLATRHTPVPSWQAVPIAPFAVRYSRQICPDALVKAGLFVYVMFAGAAGGVAAAAGG
jgi:hypothetical protein